VLPARVLIGQSGELAVHGHGPEDRVEREMVLCDEIDPVGGHGRDGGFSGKAMAGDHSVAWGHLHVDPPGRARGIHLK